MTPPTISMAKRLGCVAFVALVLALAAGAAYAWSLRCEGFGCTGIGILWAAWAAAYTVVLATGAVLRSVLPRRAAIRSAVSWGLSVQVGLGIALAGYWLLRHAA